MSNQESTGVASLAEQVEATNEAVVAAAAACTPEQWQTPVPEDGRPVGVVFHHIAFAYPFIGNWATQVANGEALPPLTYDDIHNINAQHASANAEATQEETLALLRKNGTAVIAQIQSLQDEQLERTAPFTLTGGKEIKARQVVEWFLISHANNHLNDIRKALETT